MTFSVRRETEQVEATRAGIFPPYIADWERKFIPGLTTVYVTVDGKELPPMSPEQFAEWKAQSTGGSFQDPAKEQS